MLRKKNCTCKQAEYAWKIFWFLWTFRLSYKKAKPDEEGRKRRRNVSKHLYIELNEQSSEFN